jgi:hypothetical protein
MAKAETSSAALQRRKRRKKADVVRRRKVGSVGKLGVYIEKPDRV